MWHTRGAEELSKAGVVYHTHLHETVNERDTYETKAEKTAIQSLNDAGTDDSILIAYFMNHRIKK